MSEIKVIYFNKTWIKWSMMEYFFELRYMSETEWRRRKKNTLKLALSNFCKDNTRCYVQIN